MTSYEITARIRALNRTLRELRRTYALTAGATNNAALETRLKIFVIVDIIASMGGAFDAEGIPADKP